ncbi:unnamed protein product [Callosobruchus maculatus]|uniref:Uncharacterized protein n=1 Tax=Callosobruchus maculatus TaxID=64391 RepID=A0A653BZ65_CALMS|nr:unnamed protein product [Callosobruchus maculatus]
MRRRISFVVATAIMREELKKSDNNSIIICNFLSLIFMLPFICYLPLCDVIL